MELLLAFGPALWLGVMTSISPCPLASNIAAITFLSKKIAHPLLVLFSGIAYTAGRMLVYAGLGLLVMYSFLSVPQLAQFLQKYMAQALGPILIVTGLILLKIIQPQFSGLTLSHKHHSALAEAGVPGAFALGIVFALAFCPVSAALFFGSLVPLALGSRGGASLIFIYGMGTGLPVLAFAMAIAVGVRSLSRWFHRIAKLEYYTRIITGTVFVLIGLYYTGVFLWSMVNMKNGS